MTSHAHSFRGKFAEAVLKALGLEGRKIRRLILTMEVDKPITLQVDEYAVFEDGTEYLVANLLELTKFEPPTTTTTEETDNANWKN